jgi:AcrR family transcriptional regulator
MARDDKRDRILSAAATVFAERDFHRVQVSDVAERARVGKGTVYLYFPTKDDLHRAALEASLDGVRIEVEAAVAAGREADVTLRAIVLVVQRYERGRRGTLRRHVVLLAISDVLARHRLGGTASERHLASAFLLGMARAAILEHAPSDRPEAVAARLVGVFLHGVGPRQRAAHRGAA